MSIYMEKMREDEELRVKLIEHHNKHRTLYCSVVDALPELTNLTPYIADITIGISGDKHKLESAWGALRKHGFECTGTRPGKNDPTWTGWFNHPSGAGVYLSFTSAVCRRVKIGTKTVEQDVYETVCGELGENLQPVTP